MLVWRFSRDIYAAGPVSGPDSGQGAFLFGGRWNSPGTRVLYTGASRSVVQLEMLVHFDREDAPTDFVALGIELPDDASVEELDPKSLTPNWRDYPAPPQLAAFGDEWAAQGRSLALKVPSAVEPGDFNYVLNPLHAEAPRLTVVVREPIVFDPRLFDPAKRTIAPAAARKAKPAAAPKAKPAKRPPAKRKK